jgi:hypothetical protein
VRLSVEISRLFRKGNLRTNEGETKVQFRDE